MSLVVNHLLFHKAMVGIDIDRVDQYIEIASGASSAAEVSTIVPPWAFSSENVPVQPSPGHHQAGPFIEPEKVT